MKKLFIWVFLTIFFITSCRHRESNYTTISYSTWGSRSEISLIKELISSYEKENPNVKIKLIHIPDNYFQKLHLLIASDLSPDIIFINNLNSRIYIDANKLEPLNKYMNNIKTRFWVKSLLPLTHDGEIYAIPRDISNMVIYYNADIFDMYKIPYPNANWTFDNFLKTSKQLTKDENNDGIPEIFGFGFEKTAIYWLPFLLSNGGGIISQDEKNIILNMNKSIEGIQFYSDLRNKYHVAPQSSEQSSLTTSQLFLQGKIAMHLCGRWCAQTYKNNAKFNWNIVPFPNGTNGSIVGLDASGWAISKSSKYKKEAWKFIEYISSDKAAEIFAQSALIFPANKNVATSEVFLSQPPQNNMVYISALNSSVATPICSKYTEITDILVETLEPVFDGKKQAKEVITEKLIKRLNEKLHPVEK